MNKCNGIRRSQGRFVCSVLALAVAGLLSACAQNQATNRADGATSRGIPKVSVSLEKASKPEQPPDLVKREVAASPIDLLGNGAGEQGIRVALILPLSARGSISTLAESMLSAAEMGVFDFKADKVTLIPLDNRGTVNGTKEAARRAIDLGADVVLGPLLSRNVPPAWQEIGPYNVPIISFSSDTAVAGDGVLLMSVTPEQSIDTVVEFATEHGLLRFAALIPDTSYGLVSEQAFVDSALNHGATVVQIERYQPTSSSGIAAAERLAKWIRAGRAPVDAIFIPDTPQMAKTLAPVFPYHTVDTQSVRLLGSGLWKSQNLSNESALIGAWYAATPDVAFEQFARRYRSRFRRVPPRLAALTYDAVSMVTAFAKENVNPSIEALSQPSGYVGIDGLFRFSENGNAERSLDVMQVGPKESLLISPAALTFESADQQ